MKSLLASLIFLSIAPTCRGVGNEVLEDLTALRRIGFGFTGLSAPSGDTVAFEVKVPAGLLMAEDIGTKPFAEISLVEFRPPIEPGPMLIGAHVSQVELECRKSAEGHEVARVTVRLSKLETSYLMVTFVHPGEGQWPMLIHVPVAGVVKQLTAEPAAAPDRSLSPPPLKSESPVRGPEDQGPGPRQSE